MAAAALARPGAVRRRGARLARGHGRARTSRSSTRALDGREALEPAARARAAEMLLARRRTGCEQAMLTVLLAARRRRCSPPSSREWASTAEMAERCRAQRIEGWRDDDLAFVKPWGFELARHPRPDAPLQGAQDLMVPRRPRPLARRAQIPGVEAQISDDDGHLTLSVEPHPRGPRLAAEQF